MIYPSSKMTAKIYAYFGDQKAGDQLIIAHAHGGSPFNISISSILFLSVSSFLLILQHLH